MKKRLMAIAATLALASSLLLIPVPSTMADEPVNPVSPSYNEGSLVFEAETYSAKADSVYPANDQEKESLAGYSGGGFMRVIEGDITYNIKVPLAGAYAVHIFGANVDASGRKHDSVYINGTGILRGHAGAGLCLAGCAAVYCRVGRRSRRLCFHSRGVRQHDGRRQHDPDRQKQRRLSLLRQNRPHAGVDPIRRRTARLGHRAPSLRRAADGQGVL